MLAAKKLEIEKAIIYLKMEAIHQRDHYKLIAKELRLFLDRQDEEGKREAWNCAMQMLDELPDNAIKNQNKFKDHLLK